MTDPVENYIYAIRHVLKLVDLQALILDVHSFGLYKVERKAMISNSTSFFFRFSLWKYTRNQKLTFFHFHPTKYRLLYAHFSGTFVNAH